MEGRVRIKDADECRGELLEKHGEAAARTYDHLLHEGRKIEAILWLQEHGIRHAEESCRSEKPGPSV